MVADVPRAGCAEVDPHAAAGVARALINARGVHLHVLYSGDPALQVVVFDLHRDRIGFRFAVAQAETEGDVLSFGPPGDLAGFPRGAWVAGFHVDGDVAIVEQDLRQDRAARVGLAVIVHPDCVPAHDAVKLVEVDKAAFCIGAQRIPAGGKGSVAFDYAAIRPDNHDVKVLCCGEPATIDGNDGVGFIVGLGCPDGGRVCRSRGCAQYEPEGQEYRQPGEKDHEDAATEYPEHIILQAQDAYGASMCKTTLVSEDLSYRPNRHRLPGPTGSEDVQKSGRVGLRAGRVSATSHRCLRPRGKRRGT